MSKSEKLRILRNVRQMYFDVLKYKVGGRRLVALDGLCIVLATFFNMPRAVDKAWLDKHKDVWDLYQEINGSRGKDND